MSIVPRRKYRTCLSTGRANSKGAAHQKWQHHNDSTNIRGVIISQPFRHRSKCTGSRRRQRQALSTTSCDMNPFNVFATLQLALNTPTAARLTAVSANQPNLTSI